MKIKHLREKVILDTKKFLDTHKKKSTDVSHEYYKYINVMQKGGDSMMVDPLFWQ